MAPSSRCGWEGREPTNSPDPAIVVRRGSATQGSFPFCHEASHDLLAYGLYGTPYR